VGERGGQALDSCYKIKTTPAAGIGCHARGFVVCGVTSMDICQ
jgi:hypothetical protein